MQVDAGGARRRRGQHASTLGVGRAYFAASIPDRGDAYFSDFDARHRELLAEQAAGLHHFHVLVGAGGEVLGRVNLIDVADGVAELGYRIAEKAAGQGLATAAVREVCGLAASAYGLSRLRAVSTLDNAASRSVLARAGFAPVGDIVVDGRPGLRYLRRLTDPAPRECVKAIAIGYQTGVKGVIVVATRKQTKAARANVKQAQPTAQAKKTISKLPQDVRKDLGRQGDKARTRGGKAGHALEDRTRNDLYELAKQHKIAGRSKMGKWELIDAIRAAR